jgi:Fe-S cluster assembly protein SufD
MSVATATQLSPALERYRQAFESRFASDRLVDARREALHRFLAAGFPTPRNEAWKYTNLRRLESRAFSLPTDTPVSIESAQQQWISGSATRLVFVNGRFSSAVSNLMPQPPGATVIALGEWLKHEPERALDYLKASPCEPNALSDLNTAFAEDGVVIELADNAAFDTAVQVVHLWAHAEQPVMSHPRIIIRAGRHSRLTLIEQYVALGDIEAFTNSVASVELQAGAKVEHYRLQQESERTFHIGQTSVAAQEHATYALRDLSFGGTLSRLNVCARLLGSGSHVDLTGLLTPHRSQHIDAHTRIEHVAPHTTSHEDYRGIADGKGRGVFNGKVLVHPGAQKTDARQSSRNLLLSPTAEIDAKPELEIYANDVKCSHGATTGQLDSTALFYLRSRGVSESEARMMLIRAFAQSIRASIASEPVREYVEQLLTVRFADIQRNAA